MIKGRKDMKKVLMEKKVKKKREVDVKVDNDEDKYLNEDEMVWERKWKIQRNTFQS